MFFNEFPYTDFHELNLDWIIRMMKELRQAMTDFEAMNKITFAGAWDITKQYPAWNIVNNGGQGYISIRPVPAGVNITDQNYWRGVVDYTATIADLQNRVVTLEGEMDDVQDILDNTPWVNVRDYGAKGNGVDDDTAAFNAAITAAVSLAPKAIIYVPNGSYKIKSTIDIAPLDNRNLTLRGAGRGSSILIRDSSFTSGPMITNSHSGYNSIEDIRLENGGSPYFSNTGFGIFAKNRMKMKGVYVMNGYGGFDVDVNDVQMIDCAAFFDYVYTADYDCLAGLRIGETAPVSGFMAVNCFFNNQDVNAAHPLQNGIYGTPDVNSGNHTRA